MNQGVKILLERMRSNPDEFVPSIYAEYPKKWRNIMLSVQMRAKGGKDYNDQLPFLSDEEIKTLWDGMQQLQGDLFTKQVMNTLLSDAEELSPLNSTNPLSVSDSITITNGGAMSGTISARTAVGKLRYP